MYSYPKTIHGISTSAPSSIYSANIHSAPYARHNTWQNQALIHRPTACGLGTGSWVSSLQVRSLCGFFPSFSLQMTLFISQWRNRSWEARIPWGWQSENTDDRLHTCLGSGAAGQHTIEQCSVQQGPRVPSLSVCRHHGGCSSLDTNISLYGVWEEYSDHEGLGSHWLKPVS